MSTGAGEAAEVIQLHEAQLRAERDAARREAAAANAALAHALAGFAKKPDPPPPGFVDDFKDAKLCGRRFTPVMVGIHAGIVLDWYEIGSQSAEEVWEKVKPQLP